MKPEQIPEFMRLAVGSEDLASIAERLPSIHREATATDFVEKFLELRVKRHPNPEIDMRVKWRRLRYLAQVARECWQRAA